MAQDKATDAGAEATKAAARSDMWLSVAFYILMFVAAGFILGVVGRALKVYELTASATGKKKALTGIQSTQHYSLQLVS